VDAPQLPDAEASAPPTGPQPPGQFSAFRRALDAQADPPSASGPTVVMPAVSSPELHATTVITRGAHPRHAGRTPDSAADASPAETDESPDSTSTIAYSSRSSRLSTTVGISILLAIVAGTALVLISLGVSGGPLAPTAMPTKPVATRGPVPKTSPSPAAAHNADALPAPSHPAPPPVPVLISRSAAPSQSATPNHTIAAVPAGGTASFATITWTSTSEPVVVDIQVRLTKLGYLSPSNNGSQYTVTQKTFDDVQWWPAADQVGFYQNSTDSAIRSFEFDFLQHHHGQLPDGGCTSQTYQALVQATT